MQGIDIEMGEGGVGEGGRSANPLHDKKEVKKETSERKFLQHAEEQAKEAARKGLGTGASANEQAQQGVNAEAMGRVMSGGVGGMELERLYIANNWAQNFESLFFFNHLLPWPIMNKVLEWIEMLFTLFFTLAFYYNFGGIGEEVSTAQGLLVPAWLVWEFDAGLFWEMTYFGFAFMNRKGEVLEGIPNKIGFALAGLMPVAAIVLS